jgi:poly-gamma-glutamate synthase PgsB/CapB
MIGLILSLLILFALMARWRYVRRQHDRLMEQIGIRVHVNGIRGKSTVSRLVAGVLREGGYETIAKTTGSAARVIHPDGTESPILRLGAATITEQMRILQDETTPTTQAMVMECMAVNPAYQKITQEQIVKGNITIITNVREDHQDLMGETLPEIADSLSNTIPTNGLVITAEDRPHLREQLRRNTLARGSQFMVADAGWVTDEDLRRFNYLSFKDNIAIGLAVANLLGIPREVAMRGMVKAIPDIGVVFIKHLTIQAKQIVWAPLFAVNDRESTIMGINALRPYHQPTATRIGILNNRPDRAVRALQFADVAARDLDMDYLVTFGAYERQVTDRIVALGFPRDRVITLGNSRNPTLHEILDTIAGLITGEQGLLVGMVNIHTPQAELLMHHFEELEHAARAADNQIVADVAYAPAHLQRHRYAWAHLFQNLQTELRPA